MIRPNMDFLPIERPDTDTEREIKRRLAELQREYAERAQPYINMLTMLDQCNPKVTGWIYTPPEKLE